MESITPPPPPPQVNYELTWYQKYDGEEREEAYHGKDWGRLCREGEGR